MTAPADEPTTTTVLSLPLLKTPKEAKTFVKQNFGHVVLHCFTVQANPTFSGSVGTGKQVAVSPFAYLNDTIEIAKLYANTDLDIKRSVAICPLCNMAYEAVRNRVKKIDNETF